MTRRWMLGLTVGLAVFAAAAVPVAAQEPDGIDGEPLITEDVHTPAGYYLWRGDGGMHLRTHGTRDGVRYTAYLHTDGVFVDVDPTRLERGDRVAVLNGGHTLVIQVRTFEGIDGVNFRVRDGDILALTLLANGRLERTSHIFLGRVPHHPATNPFVLYL